MRLFEWRRAAGRTVQRSIVRKALQKDYRTQRFPGVQTPVRGAGRRRRPSVVAASWRAGGAPGLRPDENKKYRFDEDRRSARWFSGSLRRVAVFGPYRSASDGRGRPATPPGTAEYPPRPLPPSRTRRRRSRVFGPQDPIPLHRSRRLQGRRPYEPSVRRDGERWHRAGPRRGSRGGKREGS